jgi:hypothetical protein
MGLCKESASLQPRVQALGCEIESTEGRGGPAAYLLNEAASLARHSTTLRPLLSASLRLRLARPQVGGQLISRAVFCTPCGWH